MTTQIRTPTYFAVCAQNFQSRGQIITLNAFRQCITEWCRRVRERNELRKLSHRDLADFMCSKADACAETSKWFWEA
ncbi:MAG TPA: hypothetical protein VEI95_13655 [Acidobacteriota bacterium]|nr:hypothetical protein [Acidobacteriota bacterium]